MLYTLHLYVTYELCLSKTGRKGKRSPKGDVTEDVELSVAITFQVNTEKGRRGSGSCRDERSAEEGSV